MGHPVYRFITKKTLKKLVLAKSFEKMPFSKIILGIITLHFGDYYVAFRGLLRCFSGIITVPE
jgi:hypothetical protein